MRSGIFAVVNIGKLRLYIGETHQIEERWSPVLQQLSQGMHPNSTLQEEWERHKGQRRLTFHVAQDLISDRSLLGRAQLKADLGISQKRR